MISIQQTVVSIPRTVWQEKMTQINECSHHCTVSTNIPNVHYQSPPQKRLIGGTAFEECVLNLKVLVVGQPGAVEVKRAFRLRGLQQLLLTQRCACHSSAGKGQFPAARFAPVTGTSLFLVPCYSCLFGLLCCHVTNAGPSIVTCGTVDASSLRSTTASRKAVDTNMSCLTIFSASNKTSGASSNSSTEVQLLHLLPYYFDWSRNKFRLS